MANHLYIEIQFICVVFFGVMLYRLYVAGDNRTSQLFFKILIALGLICFLCDGCQAIAREVNPNNPVPIYFFNIVYYISLAAGGHFWFLYSETEQGETYVNSRKIQLLISIPAQFVCLLALSAPFNHLLFYVTDTGNYTRGDLHFIQLLISYAYISITSIKAFVLSTKVKDVTKRSHLRTTAGLIIPIAICGACQIALPNLPILCVGYCDSLLFCYLAMQEENISIDPLTGISNRRRLLHNLETLIDRAEDSGTPFGVLMVDVDKFKGINDTYGHVEGDNALKQIAAALKSVSEPGVNIYRYGGDEFIVTSENGAEANLWMLAQKIQSAVVAEAKAAKAPYRLAASVGFTSFVTGDTPRSIIERADRKLYDQKRSKESSFIYVD